MLQSKLILAAIAAVVMLVGGMALYAKNAAYDVELLTVQVEKLKADKEAKQAEVNTLANAVESVSFNNKQLLAERKSIEAIRAQADAIQVRLQTELTKANAKVEELRLSNNEYVKSWANAAYPDDAVRLLKYAKTRSNNPDGNSNQASVFNTTGRLVAQLPTGYQF